MRILTFAAAAMLVVSFGATASAAKKKAPSVATFEQCEQLAIERGVPHGQTGHSEFVEQCMGKRPRGRIAPSG